jgi:trimethylamine---corrinoid protein Co-methyltransferase
MPLPSFFSTQQDLLALHQAALQILARLGIRIGHEGMRARLAGAGCRMSEDRAYIPEELIDRTLAQVPASFELCGRIPERRVRLAAKGRTWTTNTGIFPSIVDGETGRWRRSTREDVVASTRLLDALPNTDVVYVSLLDATELLPHMVTVTDFALTLAHTIKPLIGPGVTRRAEAEAIVALARAVRGGDGQALRDFPPCAPFICPITPLTFPAGIVDALEVIADAGLPLLVITNPVMGLTAPNTLAGTVALGHAEVLAAIVMAYLLAPGLPIIYQNTPSVADMRTLTSTTGGPETGLIRRTVAELSAYLGIPACVHGHTSSATLDWQAGDEKALNTLLLATARPALLGGQGALANVTACAFEALVLDDERYGAIRRILEGVTVDEDHLGLEVIAELAQGDNALAHPHTRKHLRSGETWKPRLAVRQPAIDSAARDDIIARARGEVRRLLDTHRSESLAPQVAAELDRILLEYDARERSVQP